MEGDPSKTTADFPFHQEAPSDLILRSKDGIDFFVLRAFIEYNLEGLSGLFSGHTFAEQFRDNLPVAPLPEDCIVLKTMLSLCYPGPPVSFIDILHVLAVEEAISKYCCNKLVMDSFRKALLVSDLITKKPDEVFLIGSRRRWEEVCVAAAKNSFALDTTSFHERHFAEEEIRGSSAYDLSCLMEYHQSCRHVASKFAHDLWNSTNTTPVFWLHEIPFKLDVDGHSSTCRAYRHPIYATEYPERNVVMVKVPTWWLRYLDTIGIKFQERPHKDTIRNSPSMRNAIEQATDNCRKCAEDSVNMVFQLYNFTMLYAARIEHLVSEVKLNMNFQK